MRFSISNDVGRQSGRCAGLAVCEERPEHLEDAPGSGDDAETIVTVTLAQVTFLIIRISTFPRQQ